MLSDYDNGVSFPFSDPSFHKVGQVQKQKTVFGFQPKHIENVLINHTNR